MENRANRATDQRPEGDRTIDASLVVMNLNRFIEQIRSEPSWHDSDRNSITIFKSDTLRLVLIGLHRGAVMKPHTARGIITVQVLEGVIRFDAESESHELAQGQMIALHEKIPHSVAALEESIILLTLAMS